MARGTVVESSSIAHPDRCKTACAVARRAAMSRKPVLGIQLTLILMLGALAPAKCRGDEFDDKLKQFQKQREGEASALKLEVFAALDQAEALAHAAPARSEKLLRPPLQRLFDDAKLPR